MKRWRHRRASHAALHNFRLRWNPGITTIGDGAEHVYETPTTGQLGKDGNSHACARAACVPVSAFHDRNPDEVAIQLSDRDDTRFTPAERRRSWPRVRKAARLSYCFTNSTRRFLERPSSVSLDATGALGPSPKACNLAVATPYLVVSTAETASARRLESSRFKSSAP